MSLPKQWTEWTDLCEGVYNHILLKKAKNLRQFSNFSPSPSPTFWGQLDFVNFFIDFLFIRLALEMIWLIFGLF